ncbi:MAG: type VI secretion protein [Wolbachia endosymbiont of Menacanthus eurysternus]|nr:MAG: type VI secretion protein [Wolbachia endosymbiont of Menacanthus eurysternus]
MKSKEELDNSRNESEVESKIVIFGSNQGYRVLVVIIFILLVGGVITYYYFNLSPDEKSVKIFREEEIEQNIQELKGKLEHVPDDVITYDERIITDLPSLPPLPIPHGIPEVEQIEKEDVSLKKRDEKPIETYVSTNAPSLPKQSRHGNNIITSDLSNSFPIIGDSGYPKDRRGVQMLVISNNPKNDKVVDTILFNTSAQPNVATKVGKLGFMITQGKIIDAVLETAINSDLQGMLRAIVSSNVYAESGDTVLIPRGSRLIGSYSFDSNITKARVNINWNRIILPHGIDIAISSSGIDELGSAGITGIVDNKITNALFSSILLAGVSIGSSVIGQKVSNFVDSLTFMDAVRSITATAIDFYSLKDIIKLGKEIPSDKWKLDFEAIGRIKSAKNEKDLLNIIKEEIASALEIEKGEININLENINQLLQQFFKKNKSIYDEAVNRLIGDFSKDMRDLINRSIDKKITVFISQGTALKVFVKQDIIFPLQAVLK